MKINVKVTYYSIIYVQMITSVKLPMSGNVHFALGNTEALHISLKTIYFVREYFFAISQFL